MILRGDVREQGTVRECGAPVTWLASYPRSGNTLLRIVLNRCFGVSSQSIYADVEFPDPAVRGEVGHEAIGDDPKGFLAAARRSGRSLYVKTHELPSPDRHPAIYVLRDGRSAVVSHAHYMREFFHRDVPLTDIIAGKLGASCIAACECGPGRAPQPSGGAL